jgi:DNA-directed RNA polymerase specialized sigma24 family protein
LIELRLEGYRITEIAEELGCGAGSLRARLSRLRQRFREAGYQEWL